MGFKSVKKNEKDEIIFENLVTIKCKYAWNLGEEVKLPEFASFMVTLCKKDDGALYYTLYQGFGTYEYYKYRELGLLDNHNKEYLFQSNWGKAISLFREDEWEEVQKYIPLTQKINGEIKRIPMYTYNDDDNLYVVPINLS
ncbi:hypothetical protein [Clostridium sardiniense]|uniref:hypothetical protein n=1 Tax=Clostridium sardiniense TaxID=29369 RepID=UPI0019569114|nr:hypothetical protein [Clostridium sardiniense]MBM7836313.1 hypothetical protein [Clostridium sardiniense]